MSDKTSTGCRARVLYLVGFGEPVVDIIREEVPDELELVTPKSKERQDILSALKHTDFVMTVAMDGELIEAAPRLKLIQMTGVGYDGIDVETATRRGVPVALTVEGTIIGVAEHTLLLILALYRRLLEVDASLRRGEWLVWQLRPSSFSLEEKTVGLIGLGRIGLQVARRCRAFDTRICYSDIVRADRRIEEDLDLEYIPRDELLDRADIVSLHCPLTSETQRFFGEAEFRRMKSSALFINTARGSLVDEDALVRALREGWIAGAGLDVFDSEPVNKDNPLLKLDNTVLTPHVATGTRDSVIGKTRTACANILRVLNKERPLDLVNPEVYQ